MMINTGSPVVYQPLIYEESQNITWFRVGILLTLIKHATFWEYYINYDYKLSNGTPVCHDYEPKPNIFTDKNDMLIKIKKDIESIVNDKFNGNFKFINTSLNEAIDELKENKRVFKKITATDFKQLELF